MGANGSVAGLLLRLQLGGALFVVTPALGQTPEGTGTKMYLHIRYDIGRASSGAPQTLPPDWPLRFQPPGGSMRTTPAEHAWFGEIGLGVEPRWPLGEGEIGVPISYSFVGLSSREKRFYSIRRPVAGTQLDWFEPVRLQSIAVERTSPLIGVSYTRGRISIRPALQSYRLVAEDFAGKNRSASELHEIRNLASGLGQRYEVQVRVDPEEVLRVRFAPWNTGAVGFFYERHGSNAWQIGFSLTASMELAVRRAPRQ
jgi:hypothetical protein